MHLPQPVHHQLFLQDQVPAPGLLETFTLKALAPARPHPGQMLCHQEHPPHTLLPQCRLPHRPLLGVLQDQDAAKEVPPQQEARNPRIDTSKMCQPDLVEKFVDSLERELAASQSGDSATEKWETLQDTMHRTTLVTFGRRTHDWFEAKSAEMTLIITAKCAVLAEYKGSPSEQNLQILRAARSKAQQTARCCVNEYWTELSKAIQTAAITGNIRGMYDGIKKVLGPAQKKTASLKSSTGEVSTDKGQQIERWVEHYSDLYSRQNIVSPAALDTIQCLPTMEELDTEPTVEELSKAIDRMAAGKAPGSEGIPPHLNQALNDHPTAPTA